MKEIKRVPVFLKHSVYCDIVYLSVLSAVKANKRVH